MIERQHQRTPIPHLRRRMSLNV